MPHLFSRTKLGEERNVGYMIMNVVPFPKANGMSFHNIVIGKPKPSLKSKT
jgi:hypothetical protein